MVNIKQNISNLNKLVDAFHKKISSTAERFFGDKLKKSASRKCLEKLHSGLEEPFNNFKENITKKTKDLKSLNSFVATLQKAVLNKLGAFATGINGLLKDTDTKTLKLELQPLFKEFKTKLKENLSLVTKKNFSAVQSRFNKIRNDFYKGILELWDDRVTIGRSKRENFLMGKNMLKQASSPLLIVNHENQQKFIGLLSDKNSYSKNKIPAENKAEYMKQSVQGFIKLVDNARQGLKQIIKESKEAKHTIGFLLDKLYSADYQGFKSSIEEEPNKYDSLNLEKDIKLEDFSLKAKAPEKVITKKQFLAENKDYIKEQLTKILSFYRETSKELNAEVSAILKGIDFSNPSFIRIMSEDLFRRPENVLVDEDLRDELFKLIKKKDSYKNSLKKDLDGKTLNENVEMVQKTIDNVYEALEAELENEESIIKDTVLHLFACDKTFTPRENAKKYFEQSLFEQQ